MGKKIAAAAATMLVGLISFSAQAFPVAPSQSDPAGPAVILVAGGCGAGWHRGPGGACRPNAVVVAPGVAVAPAPVVVAPARVVVERVCPPGTHPGRYGRRCWAN